MKKRFLPNFLGGSLVCLVSALTMQQAHAQQPGAAALLYNVLAGNSSGTGGTFQVWSAPNSSDGPYMHMFTNSNSDVNVAGSVSYVAGYNSNSNSNANAHWFWARGANGEYLNLMQILRSGAVKIGTRVPSAHPDYKLAVDGKIVSTSLFITNPGNWADFVFEPTYKVRSLPELEVYLSANKHLPAIPAAREVEAKGYSVTEMDAKLLQSLEELTLQVIALNKRVQQLEAEKQQIQDATK